MKQKYLYCLILCLMAMPSLCFADFEDAIKNKIRKEMIEQCIEGFDDSDNNVPISFVLKYCRCAVDKTLEKYSAADLIEIDNYEGDFDGFADELELASKNCLTQVLRSKK